MSAKKQPSSVGGWDSRMLVLIAIAVMIAAFLIVTSRRQGDNPPFTYQESMRVIPRAASTPQAPIEQLLSLAALHQDDPQLQYRTGKVLVDSGRPIEARSYLERAVSLDPMYAEAQNALGVALAKTGKHREAMVAYRTAIDLDSDFAEAHYNLGTAALSLGDTGAAIDEFSTALELDSTLIRAHNNLGGIYAQQGELDRAIGQFEAALAIDPDFTDAHRNLAAVYEHLGNTEQAALHRAKASSID